ncbi:MAG: CRISPR-associated helicase Cas3' [Dysgonamonadaceae bacterium]
MVSDLENIKSHPEKLLKTHIEGVLNKSKTRTTSIIAKYAALFHDLGKINPNFQAKFNEIKSVGYSQHSYISAFAFLNWYINNKETGNKIFGIKGNDIIKLKLVTAIILHHHGNLPNMDENISLSTLNDLLQFLETEFAKLPISSYLSSILGFEHIPFDLSIKHWYKSDIPNIDLGLKGKEFEIKNWQKNALDYFLETQFAFASVIESDKRDAGDNNQFNYNERLDSNCAQLKESLNILFDSLSKKAYISELNNARTAIRQEAVNNLSVLLDTDQRVFTLTAPTGAGKTFTLLDIAREIQEKKENLGIIFALPFLSITEQVESIISKTLKVDILSVNSKSQNERIEKAQKEYETGQTAENLKKIIVEDFIENTFDHPLIITTFVQLFETLLSNRNSTLLKLPNFANRIFLIDEVQTLPPRLYIFFSAWLDAFCKRFNSYAILSTATMPDLRMPNKKVLSGNASFEKINPEILFRDYVVPIDLLSSHKYFNKDVFNRYVVNVIDEDLTIESLKVKILNEEKSVLIILNTIQDTKDLFNSLSDNNNVHLLNTHFTPEDRLEKIRYIKSQLERKKVILISTQLIEAGVDIDFPVVYRDLCPLPSLIQSAGRCNRNKNIDLGNVYLFQLINEKGKYSSELVYRNDGKLFLEFIKRNITGLIQEKELFNVQKYFFKLITQNLEIGAYPEEKMNLIEEINKAQFENIGKFQLINNNTFGTQYQFYIPKDDEDNEFEYLAELIKSISKENYNQAVKSKIDINSQLKKMSMRIISVRLKSKADIPPLAYPDAICGLLKLDRENYNSVIGFKSSNTDYCLL